MVIVKSPLFREFSIPPVVLLTNCKKASIGFEDEVPRFEGQNLIINDLRILQRSANVMIVNPQERLRGEIRGTGDVISVNRPPIVEVEEFFTGRLIFQD